MVDPDIGVACSTHSKGSCIHSWEIFTLNKFKNELFVLLLDTRRHPGLSLGSCRICADLQLSCLIPRTLNIDRNREISCDLSFVFSIWVGKRYWLVMHYMIFHLINSFGGNAKCANGFRFEEAFVLDLESDYCFFDFLLL